MTNEAKFTPGPWKTVDVSSGKDCVYRRIDAEGKHIGFAGAYKLPNSQEADANARLIAAAPELYERLKWAIEKLEEMGQANDYTLGLVRSIADCRTTLSKAEGRS